MRTSRAETRRSITWRIGSVTGLILVLFTVALVTAAYQISSAHQETRTAEAAQANASRAYAFDAHLQLARALLAEYLVDRDPLDVAEFWETETLADQYGTQLARELADPSARRSLARQAALNDDMDELAERFFIAVRSNEVALAHSLTLQVETNIEAQIAEAATVRSSAQARARTALADAHRRLDRVQLLLLGLALLGLAVGVLLTMLLIRTVNRSFARVRGSEARFRTLVANIPNAVYRRAADSDWSTEFLSDRIEEITGRPAADFTSGRTPYSSIVEPEQREAIGQAIAAVEDPGAFTLEYQLTHADGGTRWVRDKGQVVRGAGETIEWIDGTISDITEAKRLEAEREGIENELRIAQRLETVGQLAAGIAHEINTPVQFIGDSVRFLGQAFDDLQPVISAHQALRQAVAHNPHAAPPLAALARDAEQDADVDYLVERVPIAVERTRDGVRRISEIVGAMAEFGRVGPIAHAPADVNDALRSTLIVARNEYKYVANVATDFGELPLVDCNIGELSQVFLNLIVNAAHAIEAAGTDSAGELGTIDIRTSRENGSAIVAISDTGTGISPEIQARIFDPFFTTKGVGRGTGQGLAISRTIVVDKHHGALTFDSGPGAGTTFTIRLPITAG